MVNLDGSVRMVCVQFSFSNPSVIPEAVMRLEPETHAEHSERKARSTGMMVITPTESCSVEGLLEQLERASYELVKAFSKERIDYKDAYGKRKYWIVRFEFVRREFLELSDQFFIYKENYRGDDRTAFKEICSQAIWRIRAFSNPFYQDGEEIPDYRAISVNFESRQPLFQLDGQPVKVWRKCEDGKRIGDSPLPLKAKHLICIADNSVKIMTA